jgi:pimeloyl-ACP methyl ester carboxylesterase
MSSIGRRALFSNRARSVLQALALSVGLLLSTPCFALCPSPAPLGGSAKRLLVVSPATSQDKEHWAKFFETLKSDSRSNDIAILFFSHGVQFTSLGSAHAIARELDSCIASKMVDGRYDSVTLIGHSIGGMIARRAYLIGSGATDDTPATPAEWTRKVDRILLFASVNKGIPRDATWWSPIANWLLRLLPHPKFVLEDLAFGSDFIADTRIAWIRHFGRWSSDGKDRPTYEPPYVVQFWGTVDSIVKERDNADLDAFAGPVIVRVPGAKHGDLQRLESQFTEDPASRWALIRRQLFDTIPQTAPRAYPPRRLLFIVRGIRDSSNSDWVQDLTTRAKQLYEGNVETPEYGYFTAAQFAIRPIRAKNIPSFRDLYAERLAENPRTEFDLIAHSNGTYIFGQSAISTPSMLFKNVVLAAPVLPEEFEWAKLFGRNQIQNVRYDAAQRDWPVGVLCPALRALGFSDVGPAGLVLFGTSERMAGSQRLKKVSWYGGGHGAALTVNAAEGVDNLKHLLNFARDGSDLNSGERVFADAGWLSIVSRATPYAVWTILLLVIVGLIRRYRSGQRPTRRGMVILAAVLTLIYVALDIV